MRKHLLPALLAITLPAFWPSAMAAAQPRPNAQQIEAGVRLQIFLDNANFGPGKIDGRGGDFTRKALALYRKAQGRPGAAPEDPQAVGQRHSAPDPKRQAIDLTGLDLSSVEPVYIEYQVTKDDVASVGKLPSGPAAEAKVKWLPYASLGEELGEKFHCAPAFLKELNPKQFATLKEGSKIKVPNVKPFELGAVKGLAPGTQAEAIVANDLGEEPAQNGAAPAPAAASDKATEKTAKENAAKEVAQEVTISVSTRENMLEVHAADKILAAFPVTIGSSETASPIGNWKVVRIAKLPNFRYDVKMLEKGQRSSHFHLLPPGPNDPVGVLWIALNKKGIGIHGTDDPDSIGRSASHGCIRLANWDIVKLAELVSPGVKVSIQ